jgi:hypothetical protein
MRRLGVLLSGSEPPGQGHAALGLRPLPSPPLDPQDAMNFTFTGPNGPGLAALRPASAPASPRRGKAAESCISNVHCVIQGIRAKHKARGVQERSERRRQRRRAAAAAAGRDECASAEPPFARRPTGRRARRPRLPLPTAPLDDVDPMNFTFTGPNSPGRAASRQVSAPTSPRRGKAAESCISNVHCVIPASLRSTKLAEFKNGRNGAGATDGGPPKPTDRVRSPPSMTLMQ